MVKTSPHARLVAGVNPLLLFSPTSAGTTTPSGTPPHPGRATEAATSSTVVGSQSVVEMLRGGASKSGKEKGTRTALNPNRRTRQATTSKSRVRAESPAHRPSKKV